MKDMEQWPEDPDFRRFAAKLADAVMRAVANGWTITTMWGRDKIAAVDSRFAVRRNCCCPLATLRWPEREAFPAFVRGENPSAIDAFVAGFECNGVVAGDPYNRLGRAYRERFVK